MVGRAAVVELLWTEWDPLGLREIGGPTDEYEAIADPVGAGLRTGEGVPEVAAVLALCRARWEFEPDTATDARAADALVTWYWAAMEAHRA